MRIAMVMPSLSRLGGGLLHAVQGLSAALVRHEGIIVTLITGRDRYTDDDRAAWETAGITTRVDADWVSVLRHGLRHHADVLHPAGIWNNPAGLAAWAGHRPGVPTVLSPHGMLDAWALRHSQRKKRLIWPLERRYLDRVSAWHALCEPEAAMIRRLRFPQPIALIPNGVDLPAIANGPSADSRTLLFLSRYHGKKGLLPLLDAWASLGEVRAGWTLQLHGWGDPADVAGLRRAAARINDGSVVVGDPVFGTAKVDAFHAAAGCILPSYSEGLPMAVLEAWSHALPVLMTPHCHLPIGYQRRAALRIEPTVASIAEGLRAFMALSAEDRRAMGQRGRALVADRFTWPTVARQMASIYQRLAR